jgi:hypothetical protein
MKRGAPRIARPLTVPRNRLRQGTLWPTRHLPWGCASVGGRGDCIPRRLEYGLRELRGSVVASGTGKRISTVLVTVLRRQNASQCDEMGQFAKVLIRSKLLKSKDSCRFRPSQKWCFASWTSAVRIRPHAVASMFARMARVVLIIALVERLGVTVPASKTSARWRTG